MLNTERRKRPRDNLGLAPPSKRKDIFAARANWGETESHHEESREVYGEPIILRLILCELHGIS